MIFYISVLIFSVIIHEFGHLFACLLCKVKVKAYSIGFGPILLHKKWKGIDWRISLIPFGGYCDIEERLYTSNSLGTVSYYKQFFILIAGVLMNFLLACVCYIIQYKSIWTGIVIDFALLKYALVKNYDTIGYIIMTFNPNINLLQISFINITLVLTNLLPIPALDGGYLWMMPLRKKFGERAYRNIISFFFYSLIFGQMLLIYYWWIK